MFVLVSILSISLLIAGCAGILALLLSFVADMVSVVINARR